MRSLNISLSILFFYLAMETLGYVAIGHMDEKNMTTPLFALRGNIPTTHNSSTLYSLRPDVVNDTLQDAINPREQMSGVSLYEYIGRATYLVKAVTFIYNLLRNTTLGFGEYLQHLGTGVRLIPSYLASIIGVLVCLNHLVAAYQLLWGGDIRAGA